jgi:DNA polymerase I-like protein with 3'-5' exonuclease and polymerase domains
MPRIKRYKLDQLSKHGLSQWRQDSPKVLAVDTETTGFSWYDEPFCATVAWYGKHGVQSHYFELEYGYDALVEMLADSHLVFHNAKFDLQKLILAGIIQRDSLRPDRIEDTEGLFHMLDPHSPKKLKVLARELLGLVTDEDTAIQTAKKVLQKEYKKEHGKTLYSKDIGYHMIPREVIVPYACKDAEFTYLLWALLRPRMERYPELVELYAKEMELTLVMLDIEAKGMKVDIGYVDDTAKKYRGAIFQKELGIQDMTGLKVWYPEKSGQKTPEGCLNPASAPQLMAVFQERGIPLDSTKAETLVALEDPLAEAILALRSDKKMLDYLIGIKKETRDGIIHPGFRQHKPKTGRMSSAAEDGD